MPNDGVIAKLYHKGLDATVTFEDGFYNGYNEHFSIDIFAESLDNLYEEFEDAVRMLYQEYVDCDENELSEPAKVLRKRLIGVRTNEN